MFRNAILFSDTVTKAEVSLDEISRIRTTPALNPHDVITEPGNPVADFGIECLEQRREGKSDLCFRALDGNLRHNREQGLWRVTKPAKIFFGEPHILWQVGRRMSPDEVHDVANQLSHSHTLHRQTALPHQPLHHLSMHVRQPEVAPLEAVDEARVVDAEAVE